MVVGGGGGLGEWWWGWVDGWQQWTKRMKEFDANADLIVLRVQRVDNGQAFLLPLHPVFCRRGLGDMGVAFLPPPPITYRCGSHTTGGICQAVPNLRAESY